MKIYRATIRRQGYEHDGFEYFSNKADAEKRQRKSNFEVTGEDDFDDEETKSKSFIHDEVEVINVTPTKKGIIQMLNIHCSYPDNG